MKPGLWLALSVGHVLLACGFLYVGDPGKAWDAFLLSVLTWYISSLKRELEAR